MRGFTLIEVLLVVLIMGIITSVSFLNFSKEKSIEKSLSDASRIKQMLEIGRYHALAFNQMTGLSYEEKNGFKLLKYMKPTNFSNDRLIVRPSVSDWEQMLDDEIDAKVYVDPNVSHFALYWNEPEKVLIQDEEESERMLPFIVIFPDGTMAPDGEVVLLGDKSSEKTKLKWTNAGELELQ